MNFQGLNYLVVGAGLFGCTMAERIATQRKSKVALIDKRNHIGGNSYSEIDPETQIECHKYGSHIFHTKSKRVWDYIRQFASFNSYRHKVLSCYAGRMYPIPINLETINLFYGLSLTPSQAKQMFFSEVGQNSNHQTQSLADNALLSMNEALYKAFIENYTAKQWGVDPSQLPPSIIERIPVRFTYKTDYFDDPWQGIPLDGYARLINRMLDHENIDVYLDTDYFDISHLIPNDCFIIYSGPIDRFFKHQYGTLKWRSIRFERDIMHIGDYQGAAVINYPELNIPYTRIHEFRHYHEERSYPDNKTVIDREFPINSFSGDNPSYPVNTKADMDTYNEYKKAQLSLDNVLFGGRLGSYSYLNMDETILQALQLFDKYIMHECD